MPTVSTTGLGFESGLATGNKQVSFPHERFGSAPRGSATDLTASGLDVLLGRELSVWFLLLHKQLARRFGQRLVPRSSYGKTLRDRDAYFVVP